MTTNKFSLLPVLLAGCCLLSLPGAFADPEPVGGPDPFGYKYADSQQVAGSPGAGTRGDFGRGVDVSGPRVVVGAPYEDTGTLNSGIAYVYDTRSPTPTVPVATLKNPDPNEYDLFGFSVAISGTRVVVGGFSDELAGDPEDAGLVYVFDLASPTPGQPVAVLSSPDPQAGAWFGWTVDISGTKVAVGARFDDTGGVDAGRVFVFDLAGATPTVPVVFDNPAPAGSDEFGNELAISGNRLLVGNPEDDTDGNDMGLAYLYDLAAPGTPPVVLHDPTPTAGGRFGDSVAMSGNRFLIGGYLFNLDSATPTVPVLTLQVPATTTEFGSREALSLSGSQALMNNGTSVHVFDLDVTNPDSATGTLAATLVHPGAGSYAFVEAAAISESHVVIGDYSADAGVAGTGAAYIYDLDASGATLAATLSYPQYFPPTPEYDFVDLLVSPGAVTAAGLTGDDNAEAVEIGFEFEFYENAYTICYPSTNGLIAFGQSNATSASSEIPEGNTANNFIAAYWANLEFTGGSAVLHQTFGSAPNRIFIVQYEQVRQKGHTASTPTTFQVKLFEGNNAIEIHYKTLNHFVAPGIGEPDENVTIGIEDSSGDSGVEYLFSPVASARMDLPPSPFALRFERPVFVEIESRYTRPDGVLRSVGLGGALRPNPGRFSVPYKSLQAFEAPEYVYLNRNLEELDEIGNVSGVQPDGSVDEDKIAYYRVQNAGYAIDGEDVQGAERFFERTVSRNIRVTWKWDLQFAVFIDSVSETGAPLPGDGLGNPLPVVGRSWVAKDTDFAATVDRTVGNDTLGLDISGFRYAARKYQLHRPNAAMVERDLGDTGNRLSTEGVTLNNWMRVRWIWSAQVRYQFSASGGIAGGNALLGQSYLRRYNFDNPLTPEDESLTLQASTPTSPNPHFGTASINQVWVDLGTRVEVGAFYRTFDRCSTLANFTATPSGNLGVVGSDVSNMVDVSLKDELDRSRIARAYVVDYARNELGEIIRDGEGRFSGGATAPSEINYFYGPTVFRAEIPLGQAFDAVNSSLQLVPALCDGGVLRTGDLGPSGGFTRVGEIADGTTFGEPTRWDQLGKRLLPVQPGSYRLTWPDGNEPSTSYVIEIVTGYPGDPVNLASAREVPSGARENTAAPGAAPAYVFKAPMPAAAAKFPASPGAHYRHHFDSSADRSPPTKLDLDDTDHWSFHELTFTDRTTNAVVSGTGTDTSFNARGSGRCVLLYRYRPDPNQIADGTVTEENLAVRVVKSSPVSPISPDSDLNPLGRRGLELGGVSDGGDLGVISRDATARVIDPGRAFTVDFWLNTKHLKPTDAAVTVLSSGDGRLEVALDPATMTITADYYGLSTQHPVSTAGAGWSHYVVHVFREEFFGTEVTLLDFYANGVKDGDGIVTMLLDMLSSGNNGAIAVEPELAATSLRIGVGAVAESGLRIDQLRLFSMPLDTLDAGGNPVTYLDQGEVRDLRENRSTTLRGGGALMHFDFEAAPDDPGTGTYSFPDIGSAPAAPTAGVGPHFSNDPTGLWAGLWARLDLQEVATRLDSALDDGDFNGSGYILNANSNYNATLYQRGAEVGTWGPVFPVNEKRLYTAANRRLEVAYYENPHRSDELSHPNVAWPYIEAAYDEVVYPKFGPHKDKAIYIASRAGSEGVDRNGRLQEVFGLDAYANLTVYNQPLATVAGYNPNEEHALAVGSNRAGLKIKETGEDLPNNPPLAAFALQNDVNVTSGAGYTSDPWVLVQVDNLLTGEPEMAAYEVFKTRAGTIHFPRPSDTLVNATPGLSYESAANPEDRFLIMDPDASHDLSYAFSYPVAAGDLLVAPYPLNIVIGNSSMSDARGGNNSTQRTLWRDVNSSPWVVSGGGTFFYQFFYPFRSDFHLPTGTASGTPVAWLPDEMGGNRTFTGPGSSLQPGKVVYHSFWRSGYPKLKRGETLTYQGGEYFSENPGSNGLPALVAMKAAEIVYDNATPDMRILDSNVNSYSARIARPLDRHEYLFTVSQMADAGFSPAADPPTISVVAERWYFQGLPGSLQRRFYFDSLAEKLVFRGYLNGKDSGDPDLTAGPDPLNMLEPNLVTVDDLSKMSGIGTGADWEAAVLAIHSKSQNPMMIRAETAPNAVITGQYLSGVKESPITTQRIGLNLELLAAQGLQDSIQEQQARLDALVEELSNLEKSWEIEPRNAFASEDPYYTTENGQVALRSDVVGPLAAEIAALREELSSRDLSRVEKEISELGNKISLLAPAADSRYSQLDSFGVGAALIPNPKLLTDPVTGSDYITIVENNRSELDGAPVSLHIIELIPDRYRGALKVIEGADAFSEKVTIQHNGNFGANTGDLYYEWWIRDAAPLGIINDPADREIRGDGTLKEVDLASGLTLWEQYLPKSREEDNTLSEDEKHYGLHSIVFEGSPKVTLADKLVLMRYRHMDEDGWNLVPFEFTDPVAEWQPPTLPTDRAPFQWAGAANSPQLQASGEKVYIPQLVMGWVKRILDRINPYEARYTDFFSNESPATYSSQIQIAGAPFVGKVALNPDKDVIENTGLIELYETVLQRAKELSIENSSNPEASPGINQALLLAATRLAVLYELLAREAYSDAQDSTITVTNDDGLASVASYTHAFQNIEADLLHEELALLRGTDFLKSYPVNNRMFWNYAKGLGEAAYNVNYNIYDANTDGFINEDDARALYPQGHGDSWGHFLSALGMHYELLQQPIFSWASRSELYALMQNVLEVDFLDEKTFAKLAAGKARAGRDIIRGTYRLHYTQDPDGQWQGYGDVDKARAWGVSEWAHRAGQGAYFDWAVANALLPAEADGVPNPENLDRLERSAAVDEIGEVAGALYEIQIAMDEANNGVNPLGFDSNGIAFDLDPTFLNSESVGERLTHFEQIYLRAIAAGNNAMETLSFATAVENKLRKIADDTDAIIVEALRQDLDYRNRLIEIFGRPYDGTIGFGKVYPEGYEGPDTSLYAYIDRTTIDQIVPQTPAESDDTTVHFNNVYRRVKGAMDDSDMVSLYQDVWGGLGSGNLQEAFETLVGDNDYLLETFDEPFTAPYDTASKYGFVALDGWGQRTSYGRAQRSLEEMLRAEIEVDQAIADYIGFLQDWEVKTQRLLSELELFAESEDLRDEIDRIRKGVNGTIVAAETAIGIAQIISNVTGSVAEAVEQAIPESFGFSPDILAPARGAVLAAAVAAREPISVANDVKEIANRIAELARDEAIIGVERDIVRVERISALEGLVEELVNLSGSDQPKRDTIGITIQNLELGKQEYFTALSEGFRLLREREAFNKVLAAKVQKNRYQDMIFRLSRNEAMGKYQSSFTHAARYTWLAAKAYDYEMSLAPGHPASATQVFDQIARTRQLGLWTDGEPQIGQGGLAEILAGLFGNFEILESQLGINSLQVENEGISLRSELFRIGPGLAGGGEAASDERWVDALKARTVDDLWQVPEFRHHCRPFASRADGVQPGLVIRFRSCIEPGLNFFGRSLAAGDHAYSSSTFTTKLATVSIFLDGYDDGVLATTPRAYLVPIGTDYLRVSTANEPVTRSWNVHDTRIPTPFILNQTAISQPGFIPSLDGIDGRFYEPRRHADFRMYHVPGQELEDNEQSKRLIGRSVWNSEWLLVIPGIGLHADADYGLKEFAENVSDLKLTLKTYSHNGQ